MRKDVSPNAKEPAPQIHKVRARIGEPLRTQKGARRRRRDAVLARARLCNHARLADALRNEGLAQGVIDSDATRRGGVKGRGGRNA